MYRIAIAAAATFAFGSTASMASPINPVSYSMPNGWVYTDSGYSGGSGNVSLADLSGGLGKLTDGVVASGTWSEDTAAYVGWLSWFTPNPTVTFDFVGDPTINTIQIAVDNSGVGDVFAPGPILVDGVQYDFTAPDLGSTGFITLDGLSLTGLQHTVQFMDNGLWVFVSEVKFSGSQKLAAAPVPEPASWLFMVSGFGVAGAFMRYRRRRTVLA